MLQEKFIPRNEHYCAEVTEQEKQFEFLYTTSIYISIKTFIVLLTVNNHIWKLDPSRWELKEFCDKGAKENILIEEERWVDKKETWVKSKFRSFIIFLH